jgi:hypothetical protein
MFWHLGESEQMNIINGASRVDPKEEFWKRSLAVKDFPDLFPLYRRNVFFPGLHHIIRFEKLAGNLIRLLR